MTSTTPRFEVQISRKGRWDVVSHHADQGAAEDAARLLANAGPQVENVRVTREVLDPKTNRFTMTVVFRSLYGDKAAVDAAREAEDAKRRAERAAKKAEAARLAKGGEQQRGVSEHVLKLRSLLLVAAVAAMLVAIGGLAWLHGK